MRKLVLLVLPLLMVCLPALPQPPRPFTPLLTAGYRRWVRVNAKPHWVDGKIAYLCMVMTRAERALENGPHFARWITVYVNPIGERAMLGPVPSPFPRGSIIVKEKAARPGGSPELLTVMHKREAGYNPANGDWEYLVFNGAGTRITGRGRLASCQSCHVRWRKQDYVSRAYLFNKLGHPVN